MPFFYYILGFKQHYFTHPLDKQYQTPAYIQEDGDYLHDGRSVKESMDMF